MERHKSSKRHIYQDLIFWADRGMIAMEDRRDGSYKRASPEDFDARAEAIGAESRRCYYPLERAAMQAVANTMKRVIAEAIAQGCPLDPKVQEYDAKHRSWAGHWSQNPGMPHERCSPGGLILGNYL